MIKLRIIHLNDVSIELAEELAQILSEDGKLQGAMGSRNVKTTGEEYIIGCNKWMLSRNADMFAIVLGEKAIGSISLSHQDTVNHKARVGYWIGSSYWGNGYASQAFSQILKFARLKNILYVSATIKEDNLASKRIWERYGAKVELRNNRFHVSLDL